MALLEDTMLKLLNKAGRPCQVVLRCVVVGTGKSRQARLGSVSYVGLWKGLAGGLCFVQVWIVGERQGRHVKLCYVTAAQVVDGFC